jgi:hypothetical protein
MANEAVRLAAELGLAGTHVFFNDQWIEYRRRGLYFREADIGVSIHQTHLETYYSFRIRLLDYLKNELPILCTKGDYFAGLVEEEGLGITVESGDTAGLTRAILSLAGDREERGRIKARLAKVKTRFAWETTAAPLVEHCRRVLDGRTPKKKKPGARDIAVITDAEGRPSVTRRIGKRYFSRLLMKLPFHIGTRIKKLVRRVP